MPTKDKPGDDLEAVIRGDVAPRITDPEEAALAIVERILKAETVEDVLTMAGALGADDVLNRPFLLHGCKWIKSAYEQGAPVFAVIDATFEDTGERTVITCGGRNVLAQIVQLDKLEALPRKVKLVRTERPTSNGFYPLWLTHP